MKMEYIPTLQMSFWNVFITAKLFLLLHLKVVLPSRLFSEPLPPPHFLFILYIMLQSPVAPQPSASLFSAEKQTRVKKVFAQRLLFSFFAVSVGGVFLFTALKEMWLCKGGNDFQTLVRCLGRNCVDLSFLCCISDMNRTEVLTLVLPPRPAGQAHLSVLEI